MGLELGGTTGLKGPGSQMALPEFQQQVSDKDPMLPFGAQKESPRSSGHYTLQKIRFSLIKTVM